MRAMSIKVFNVDEEGNDLPPHTYLALGGDKIHYLQTQPFWDCDCGDWVWRDDVICKHLIRALYDEGHPIVRRKVEEFM